MHAALALRDLTNQNKADIFWENGHYPEYEKQVPDEYGLARGVQKEVVFSSDGPNMNRISEVNRKG